MRAAGHPIRHLDLGGGLGVPYRGGNDVPPSPLEYAQVVRETVGSLGLAIKLEPGRMIVANAGVLVARVIYAKRRPRQDLHRRRRRHERPDPADAVRRLSRDVARRGGARPAEPIAQDVVGPICETGDYLALDRRLPPLAAGDLVAFMTAGAYGAAMSSTYNSRLLVPEVLVKGDEFAVVRPRQTYAELIGLDRLPEWLG